MITLTSLAILPGILIVIYIFRKDKVEHEPIGLIIKMVIFGIISCAPAAFLENAEAYILPQFPQGSLANALTDAFLCAALIEEVCKYALLKIGIYRNREFDYRFDGVVYGVCVAVGFACLENVLYVMEGGISVAITRAFLSVPLHAFCGAIMGAFMGMAKKEDVEGRSPSRYLFYAVAVPILVHGIYDTFAMWNYGPASVMLLVFTGLMYVVVLKMVGDLAKDDYRMGFYNHEYEEAPVTFVPSYSTPTVKQTDGMSIAGMVLGILSLLAGGLTIILPILAIICSAKGLSNTKGRPSKAAAAGMVLGIVTLVLGGGMWIFI